jgi:hypothetical protein
VIGCVAVKDFCKTIFASGMLRCVYDLIVFDVVSAILCVDLQFQFFEGV